MFFYAAKVLGFALQPSALLVGCVIVAFVATLRGRRGVAFVSLSVAALLAVASVSPLGRLLALPLEERFARADLEAGPVTGVIVLGGGEEAGIAVRRRVHALNESGERISEFVALARRLPASRLVFSGGDGALFGGGVSEAQAVAAMLESLGVSGPRLQFEDRSRDTWENAAFSKAKVHPAPGDRWLLVTSAWHMPRAIGAFRAAGFRVEAWPVDYRTRGWDDAFAPFANPATGLRLLDLMTKEYAGLVSYWLGGRSSALFPAPCAEKAACR